MTVLVPLYPASTLWLEQGIVESVDISGFEPDDYITIALPEFPASDLNLIQSYVVFTSHPEGNFGAGPISSIPFIESETPLVDGDSEFRFQISKLSNIDLSAITGVRFTLDATAGGNDFRVLAIRAISKDWLYTPIDTDTLSKRAYRPVTLDGSVSSAYDPIFTTWPTVFRAANFTSENDPSPIDSKISLVFNPGSQNASNRISLFFRERPLDYKTQLDLDGTLSSELDGQEQPDWGIASYISRQQIDIDGVEDSVIGPGVDSGAIVGEGLLQSDLNGITQRELERKADPLTAAWIEVRLSWDGGSSSLDVYDAETATPFYHFDVTLDDNRQYVLFADLENTSLRLRLYERDANILGSLVFDSTTMNDPEVFKRRKGRIGWSADLQDGDAYIESIDPRFLNFAEYQSAPYLSLTPVVGASLDVGATPDTDLFKGINEGPWGGQFYDDTERGTESFLIRNTAVQPLQGIQTNFVYLDDLAHTKFSFEIYVTQEALDLGSIQAFFWDGDRALPLPLPPLRGNIWEQVNINLREFIDQLMPNYYSIAIVQTVVGFPNDWKIDNMHMMRKNIEWAAREYTDDPWNELSDWIEFDDSVNATNGGVLFNEHSNRFQVRAKALRQNARIAQVYATPKYAELGRITFDEKPVVQEQQVIYDTSIDGNTATFTATNDMSTIIQVVWSFGDGEIGISPNGITHTYAGAGTYPLTVTAYRSNGNILSTTNDIVIS